MIDVIYILASLFVFHFPLLSFQKHIHAFGIFGITAEYQESLALCDYLLPVGRGWLS